jgi:Zn-dependent M28 family amino/carboxypeptidase
VANKKEATKLKKSANIAMSIEITEVKVEAYNVVGYLNNHQKTTIVIGAHYDHLGWGHDGSLHSGERAIHNGADDNASGTAAMMALADFLNGNSDFAHHNYLFIAFTAEERGLLGSNYFANNPTIALSSVAYMINMDMVGRLREGNLQVSGTGTAEEWKEIFEQINCENIQFKLDPSGIGPSDHTSFYNKNIPVLHFFTGSHEDYHKPTDDADKVNFEGIERVTSIIKYIISQTAEKQFLTFTETKNENARSAPSFSVTLGIMPDYMYESGGVKVDGVSADKPAAKAGIVKGDIIVKLGNFDTQDMQGYMTALSAFKPGDKTIAVVLRNGKREEVKIQF